MRPRRSTKWNPDASFDTSSRAVTIKAQSQGPYLIIVVPVV